MRKITLLVAALCATTMAFAAATGTKVTDPTTLKAGDKIAIANVAGTKAMSTEQTAVTDKAFYRGVATFDAANVSTDVELVELEASGSNFKLKVTGGYLTIEGYTTKNWLATTETGDDFTFVTSGDTLFAKSVSTEKIILFNTDRFSAYSATSGTRTTGGTSIYVVTGEQEEPVVENKTIAEFIAAAGVKCYLTGVVDSIQNTTYGNLYMHDASGYICVYGTLNAAKESQKFAALGVEEGDTLTVLAETYKLFGTTNEAVNVIYVSHKKGEGKPTPSADVDFLMAYYYEYDGTNYMDFDIYNYDNDYPELYIGGYFEVADMTKINGTYEFGSDVEGTYYTSASDSVNIVSGTITIAYTGETSTDGYEDPMYHITATMVGEDGNTYTINVTIAAEGYDYVSDPEGTSGDAYIEFDDEVITAIRTIEVLNDVYAHDGRIYAEEGARIYSVSGLDVTRMNGNLNGVYIVKNGNKVAKVVVR